MIINDTVKLMTYIMNTNTNVWWLGCLQGKFVFIAGGCYENE